MECISLLSWESDMLSRLPRLETSKPLASRNELVRGHQRDSLTVIKVDKICDVGMYLDGMSEVEFEDSLRKLRPGSDDS